MASASAAAATQAANGPFPECGSPIGNANYGLCIYSALGLQYTPGDSTTEQGNDIGSSDSVNGDGLIVVEGSVKSGAVVNSMTFSSDITTPTTITIPSGTLVVLAGSTPTNQASGTVSSGATITNAPSASSSPSASASGSSSSSGLSTTTTSGTSTSSPSKSGAGQTFARAGSIMAAIGIVSFIIL